jgi:ribosomal protein S18 acetylase RimI-like enzyme
MQDQENAIPTIRKQTPWNKGKLTGAKPPLRPKHVWSIRTKLQIEGRARDLAMFNLAIDSKLRGCDVVAIKVDDVAAGRGPDSTILVAEEPAKRLLGFVTLFVRMIPASIVRDERRFVELDNLVVRADARRQGAGRLLVAAAAAWSASIDVPTIELSVWSLNACGKFLYHATGFETIIERMAMATARQQAPPFNQFQTLSAQNWKALSRVWPVGSKQEFFIQQAKMWRCRTGFYLSGGTTSYNRYKGFSEVLVLLIKSDFSRSFDVADLYQRSLQYS